MGKIYQILRKCNRFFLLFGHLYLYDIFATRAEVKNKHPNDTCYDEVGIGTLNSVRTIPGSIGTTILKPYLCDHFKRKRDLHWSFILFFFLHLNSTSWKFILQTFMISNWAMDEKILAPLTPPSLPIIPTQTCVGPLTHWELMWQYPVKITNIQVDIAFIIPKLVDGVPSHARSILDILSQQNMLIGTMFVWDHVIHSFSIRFKFTWPMWSYGL
jgi:hypothetical protein